MTTPPFEQLLSPPITPLVRERAPSDSTNRWIEVEYYFEGIDWKAAEDARFYPEEIVIDLGGAGFESYPNEGYLVTEDESRYQNQVFITDNSVHMLNHVWENERSTAFDISTVLRQLKRQHIISTFEPTSEL